MSTLATSLAELSEQAMVEACWRQWSSLKGEHLISGTPARAMIDPEALVLASLAVRHKEGRLRDLIAWWLPLGVRLMSVQRFKTLQKLFPESLGDSVRWFAGTAKRSGDARWASLAEPTSVEEPTRPGKGPRELTLIEPATLMLRLRAGFGVGAKADVLAFLLGSGAALGEREVWTSVSVLSKATGFSRASVRRAATDMALARLIEASGDPSPMYSVDSKSWARLLVLDDTSRQKRHAIPPWRFFGQVYAFLAACAEWGRRNSERDVPPVVEASEARDITDRFRDVGNWNGWRAIDPKAHPGAHYLEPFASYVEQVGRWVESHV